jgi:hypothetical protein
MALKLTVRQYHAPEEARILKNVVITEWLGGIYVWCVLYNHLSYTRFITGR